MKKKQESTAYFKTEDQLKEEAKRRAAEQARMQALKPQPSAKKKKADNFWYHYKWHTVGGILALLLIAFFAKDVIFRTDPDATIILATSRAMPMEATEALQTALEAVAWDYNGDGKVSIAVDAIYMPVDTGEAAETESGEAGIDVGGQSDYASVMKLTTVVAAAMDPIYLLDDDLYAYMLQMAAGSEQDDEGNIVPNAPTEEDAFAIFERLEVAGGDVRIPFAATAMADNAQLAPLAGAGFSLRIQTGDKNTDYQDYCRSLLEALVTAHMG